MAQTPAPERTLPAAVIAVVDFKRVIRESSAGQSILKQINDRHAGFQKEIQGFTAQLEQARQELARQQSILAPDVFAQKRQEFQGRAQEYQRSVQDAQKKLDTMLRQSMRTVEATLATIVAEVATEMGANLVIDAGLGRGEVLFTDSSLVITDEAKGRLNKALPDVKVVEPQPEPANEQPNREPGVR
ncbi:MAG: OmpH family outer membrane protein [Alphaproteobacteria bacterium]